MEEWSVASALDLEHKIFVLHEVTLSTDLNDESQLLKKAQIAHLKAVQVLLAVSSQYADFKKVFFP